MAISERRSFGSGSVYYVKAVDRWRYAESRQVNGRRVRKVYQRKTYDELIAWMRELDRRDSVRAINHEPDRRVMEERRQTRIDFAERVIGIAQTEGWTPDRLARVIVASLAARRIRLAVFGPCVYCGDWLADTVDHAIPTFHGGTDEPTNLVSACQRCNTEKNARLDYEARLA